VSDDDLIAKGKAISDRLTAEGVGRPTPNDLARRAKPFTNGHQHPRATEAPRANHRVRGRNSRREHTSTPGLLSKLISAADLDAMTLAPLVEHVPHLITEGFGIIAGPPKAGKSWFTAGIALACAHGGIALGGIHLHHPRDVLLLALEDGPRRLQARMQRLNHGQPLPARLGIITEITPGTAAATITEWLQLHQGDDHKPLVILDTLGKARPQRRPGEDPYIADYQLGSAIKRIVDAVPGAALVAVHHTRKLAAEDWLDTVSGTQAITGSADYILVLRRKRKSDEGVLGVTGRDIAENEYALKVDDGIWSLDGMDILDAAATVTTRSEQQQNKLGSRSLDAMKFVIARPITTPAELAAHLGIDNQPAGKLLGRLADGGYIAKTGRGTYVPLDGKSDQSGKTADQPPSGNFPLLPDLPPDE
jgi:hypothetical protein